MPLVLGGNGIWLVVIIDSSAFTNTNITFFVKTNIIANKIIPIDFY